MEQENTQNKKRIYKSSTPSFIVERKIITSFDDEYFLYSVFNQCYKIYKIGIKHYNKILEYVYKDSLFLEKDKSFSKNIKELKNKYKLNEFDIHKFLATAKHNSSLSIHIVQKIGTQIYKSLNKNICKGKFLKYKKYSFYNSFEGKNNLCGIIYKNDTVKVLGRTLKIDNVRKSDLYMQSALLSKIKYCRIVRKPFNSKYKYFLQIVMKGNAPKKLSVGSGTAGIDQGISTLAVYGKECEFFVLADGIEKYNKQIHDLSIKLERSLRLNNPECIEKNGTYKKGCKLKKSKTYFKILLKLKSVYRKRSVYIKQYNQRINNQLIKKYNKFISEHMTYSSFAKKTKETARQEKISIVNNKSVRKFKKKKRFGKSILQRSPGFRQTDLEYKCERYHCELMYVDSQNFKASQYEHDKNKYIKRNLSERTKLIDNKLVQRDLYSAFLLKNAKNTLQVNKSKCKKEFETFLLKQQELINNLDKDTTRNFGLKEFK